MGEDIILDQDYLASGSMAIAGVIVGSLLTYFLSKKMHRKDRLTGEIYRPLIGQAAQLHAIVSLGSSPDLAGLENVKHDGLYYVIDKEVRKKADLALQEAKNYRDLYEASDGRIGNIIKEVMESLASGENLEKYRGGAYEFSYAAYVNNRYMGSTRVRNCIFVGKTPIEVLKADRPIIDERSVRSYIGGYDVERSLADELVQIMLRRCEEDATIREARMLRFSLLDRLQEVIKSAKEEIT